MKRWIADWAHLDDGGWQSFLAAGITETVARIQRKLTNNLLIILILRPPMVSGSRYDHDH